MSQQAKMLLSEVAKPYKHYGTLKLNPYVWSQGGSEYKNIDCLNLKDYVLLGKDIFKKTTNGLLSYCSTIDVDFVGSGSNSSGRYKYCKTVNKDNLFIVLSASVDDNTYLNIQGYNIVGGQLVELNSVTIPVGVNVNSVRLNDYGSTGFICHNGYIYIYTSTCYVYATTINEDGLTTPKSRGLINSTYAGPKNYSFFVVDNTGSQGFLCTYNSGVGNYYTCHYFNYDSATVNRVSNLTLPIINSVDASVVRGDYCYHTESRNLVRVKFVSNTELEYKNLCLLGTDNNIYIAPCHSCNSDCRYIPLDGYHNTYRRLRFYDIPSEKSIFIDATDNCICGVIDNLLVTATQIDNLQLEQSYTLTPYTIDDRGNLSLYREGLYTTNISKIFSDIGKSYITSIMFDSDSPCSDVYMFVGGKLITVFHISQKSTYTYANCPIVIEAGQSIEFRCANLTYDCNITVFGITETEETFDPTAVFNDFKQDLNTISNNIGDIRNLPTTNKSNLVGALTEVYNFGGSSNFRLPIGTIVPYVATAAPSQWLVCDGSEISRTTYSSLFNLIGTTYGEGDGSTTFNLPDMRTRVPIGYNNIYQLGSIGGEAKHILTVNEIPSHSHTSLTTTTSYGVNGSDRGTIVTNGSTGYTGGSQPHNNMQPYIALNYIIFTGVKEGTE